ncbi:mannose-specific lectin-like isoform X2 [Oreochromis aureus]|uniref:mannose-specific lectin-like isoform X2 n=1 Tax=Oreochromis aureus TaxID=47969 RepID=UPI00195417C1|nr:mannose-specific lectin-like isoform X2 [Oreochromis aureus]
MCLDCETSLDYLKRTHAGTGRTDQLHTERLQPAGRFKPRTFFLPAGVKYSKLIMSRNFLSKNDELRRGDYLVSNNKQFKAIFQADCNLVLYNKCNTPRWSTNSCGPVANLCRLQLTDDGKLVVNRESEQIWNS